jgi:hypothetical protein
VGFFQAFTKPATFSILPFWTFFKDFSFLYYIATSALLVPCGGRKKLAVHNTIRDVIFPILEDRSTCHYCCVCGTVMFFYLAFSIWVVPVFLT